jgi:hypothetical protein
MAQTSPSQYTVPARQPWSLSSASAQRVRPHAIPRVKSAVHQDTSARKSTAAPPRPATCELAPRSTPNSIIRRKGQNQVQFGYGIGQIQTVEAIQKGEPDSSGSPWCTAMLCAPTCLARYSYSASATAFSPTGRRGLASPTLWTTEGTASKNSAGLTALPLWSDHRPR